MSIVSRGYKKAHLTYSNIQAAFHSPEFAVIVRGSWWIITIQKILLTPVHLCLADQDIFVMFSDGQEVSP